MKKLGIVIGTRPELIKVGCLIREFEIRGYRQQCIVVNTAQHKELLDPYWQLFGITPDITMDVMRHGQSLSELHARVLSQFQSTLERIDGEVGGLLAQGDTTTVLGTAMVAFYNHIPFYHLEAGLRSFNMQNPFPEEFNRKATSQISSFHFCPTETSATNLLNEGIDGNAIAVVGNTVVDALEFVKRDVMQKPDFENFILRDRIMDTQGIVLITCHRRENQGQNLLHILQAILELAIENPERMFVWTIHPSPNVRNVVLSHGVASLSNVLLVEPLSYYDIVRLLSRACMAISDSGGIQEEAPSFNVPVLVLREFTERPEGLATGASELVGADPEVIKKRFYHYLNHTIDLEKNPYGDGKSSPRVASKLIGLLSAI